MVNGPLGLNLVTRVHISSIKKSLCGRSSVLGGGSKYVFCTIQTVSTPLRILVLSLSLLVNVIYCVAVFSSFREGELHYGKSGVLFSILYLFAFYISQMLLTLKSWKNSIALKNHLSLQIGTVALFRFRLKHIALLILFLAVLLSFCKSISQGFACTLMILAATDLVVLKLGRGQITEDTFIANNFTWWFGGLLMLLGGTFAVIIGDALDGAFGNTWLYRGLDATQIHRGWPLVLTFFSGGYLTLVSLWRTPSVPLVNIELPIIHILALLGLLELSLLGIACIRYSPSTIHELNALSFQSGTAILLGVPMGAWLICVAVFLNYSQPKNVLTPNRLY